MNNQLDAGIVTMSDDYFNSMLNGETVAQIETVDTTNEQPQDIPVQIETGTEGIGQLDDNTFKALELTNGEDTPDAATATADTEVTEATTTDVEPTVVLQNITDFFIEKGIWDDFEGREDFEFNNDNFQELLVKQNANKVSKEVESIIESTGDYGKAIINYIQEGGNPDDIIDLFKEQKDVLNVDVSDEDNKKAYIEQYYTTVVGMKPERAKKIVTDLEMDGELDNELVDVKAHYESHYKAQRLDIERKQQEAKQQRIEQEESFRNNILSEVSKRTDLTEKERRSLAESILVQDQKLSDGTAVNKFYTAFAQVQSSLPDYLDLVQFVTNKQAYLDKVKAQERNKTTEKDFNFIKRNSAVSRKTGSTALQTRTPTTTFRFN